MKVVLDYVESDPRFALGNVWRITATNEDGTTLWSFASSRTGCIALAKKRGVKLVDVIWTPVAKANKWKLLRTNKLEVKRG